MDLTMCPRESSSTHRKVHRRIQKGKDRNLNDDGGTCGCTQQTLKYQKRSNSRHRRSLVLLAVGTILLFTTFSTSVLALEDDQTQNIQTPQSDQSNANSQENIHTPDTSSSVDSTTQPDTTESTDSDLKPGDIPIPPINVKVETPEQASEDLLNHIADAVENAGHSADGYRKPEVLAKFTEMMKEKLAGTHISDVEKKVRQKLTEMAEEEASRFHEEPAFLKAGTEVGDDGIDLVGSDEIDTSESVEGEESPMDEAVAETADEVVDGDAPVSDLEAWLQPPDSKLALEDTRYLPKDRFILAQELLFQGQEGVQEEAFKILSDLANRHGLPNAQQALSFMYLNGVGAKQDLTKALIYKTFGALGGDENARQSLGFQYLTGSGVQKDCEKALVYYQQVAEKVIERYRAAGLTTLSNRHNNDLAKFQVKLYEYNDRSMETAADATQEEEALDWIKFRQAKAITDPDQLLVIGQYYMNGMFGVTRNLKKAEESFKKVGEDHPLALAYLGKIYLEGGEGVEKDVESALEYLNKAVRKGSAVARATLGYMHLNGIGVPKSEKMAQDYFEASAKSGWFEGAVHLGEMYYEGKVEGGQTLKNYQMALKYFGIASQQRNIVAMYYMGKMHMSGKGASRNCATATGFFKEVVEMGDKFNINLWRQAFTAYQAGDKQSALVYYLYLADLGFEIAQVNAAQIIQDGEGFVSQSEKEQATEYRGGHVRAKFNWQRAADQSNLCASVATLQLGDFYYFYDQNYDKAVNLYRSSGDTHSNPQALFNIGYMYQYGQGLKQDLHLAKRYFDKAVEVDQDAAIPVFLALVKLLVDFLIQKSQKLFVMDTFDVSNIDVENYLVTYLGHHWDVILMTVLVFIGGFVLAWRRQNQLLYRRQRAQELQRLLDLHNQKQAEEAAAMVEAARAAVPEAAALAGLERIEEDSDALNSTSGEAAAPDTQTRVEPET